MNPFDNSKKQYLIISDLDDVLSGRDEKPWAGSGFRAGLFHDNALRHIVFISLLIDEL